VPRRPAVDPELAERPIRIAQEEPRHGRFLDAVPTTPDVQALGLREVHDADARGSPREANGVEGRHLAVRQGPAFEQVLDPVPCRGHREKAKVAPGSAMTTRRITNRLYGAGPRATAAGA
jgi:hypothetical protein